MRKIAMLVVGLALAACAEKKAEVAAVPEDRSLIVPGCYTVDLFETVNIKKPEPNVPAEYARYLGEWGNGAWNGDWCHDLLIYGVHADGRVELVDMHAPSDTYKAAATAFKRTARIQEDGSIRFRHGIYQRRYEIVDGRLYGTLDSPVYGTLNIILSRKGVVPLPPVRPIRVASAQVSQAVPAE